MTKKRTYGDVCGVARALDMVGERWALLVVRELMLGPKRFTDLRAGLPHVSPDVLAQRLRELSDAEVIQKRQLPPPAASQVYELTPLGRQLEDTVLALGRFGALLPIPDPDAGMSFDAHILSLIALFDGDLAGDLDAVVALTVEDQPFRAEVSAGQFAIVRGEAPEPDSVIETDSSTLLGLVRGWRELDEAKAAGDIRIEGDETVIERFIGLFPLPEASLALA